MILYIGIICNVFSFKSIGNFHNFSPEKVKSSGRNSIILKKKKNCLIFYKYRFLLVTNKSDRCIAELCILYILQLEILHIRYRAVLSLQWAMYNSQYCCLLKASNRVTHVPLPVQVDTFTSEHVYRYHDKTCMYIVLC